MAKGEVYVFQDATGLVKVGYSIDAKRRRGTVSYWCSAERKPVRIVCVRRYDERTATVVEKVAHRMLGIPVPMVNTDEWFITTPEIAVRKVDRAARLVRRYAKRTGRDKFSAKDVWFGRTKAEQEWAPGSRAAMASKLKTRLPPSIKPSTRAKCRRDGSTQT